MQDQLLSTSVGSYWNLENRLPNLHLNNIFKISNKIWHKLSYKCFLFQAGPASVHEQSQMSISQHWNQSFSDTMTLPTGDRLFYLKTEPFCHIAIY